MGRYKLFTKILIVLVLMVVFLCVVYYYIFIDIEKRNENALELQTNISTQDIKDQYIKSVEVTMKGSGGDIEKLNNSIVNDDGNVGFIELLENTAKLNGLDIKINSLVIEDLQSSPNSNMTTLNIRAKTNGSWSGTYLFLKELESLSYNIVVNKFDISKSTDGSDDQSINGSIRKNIKYSNVPWDGVFEIHILKYK